MTIVATIKDVAALAQVSTATVSYVLNGTGSVTEPTRKRVLEAVATLNYQPNYAARSLRSRSRTIGLVQSALSARLTDPILSELLAGITELAAKRGYYTLLAAADEAQSEQVLAEQLVRTGRIDGLVLFEPTVDDERFAYLLERQVPIVCAGLPPQGLPCPFAVAEQSAGAERGVQHLVSLGHRQIALIALPAELTASEPIYEGYRAGLAAAGLSDTPELVIEAGLEERDGHAAMQELLSLPEPPSAILAASDTLAFGAMAALREAGLVVGRDCAVVGMGDLPMAAFSNPPLTTLRVPRRALGQMLAQLLIDTIEQKTLAQSGIALDMQLIVRRSAGPLARAGYSV